MSTRLYSTNNSVDVMLEACSTHTRAGICCDATPAGMCKNGALYQRGNAVMRRFARPQRGKAAMGLQRGNAVMGCFARSVLADSPTTLAQVAWLNAPAGGTQCHRADGSGAML